LPNQDYRVHREATNVKIYVSTVFRA